MVHKRDFERPSNDDTIEGVYSGGDTIDAHAFYNEYHGHTISHLKMAHRVLCEEQGRRCIFLVGDSTLDNKYWLNARRNAVNGYERLLSPPSSVPDVAFHMNALLHECNDDNAVCLNCSIEESTLGQRRGGTLYDQDRFVRDHVTEDDDIVISCGGNDIALSPSLKTIFNLLRIIYLSSTQAVADGTAWALSSFLDLYHRQLQEFVHHLCEKRKPRRVLLCMLYYPQVERTESWANRALDAMKYAPDQNPHKVQHAIDWIFAHAVSQVKVDGVDVIPVHMKHAMDGTDKRDYVARVEPSCRGGEKMARLFMKSLATHSEHAAQPPETNDTSKEKKKRAS